ncbi:MAG: 3-phosphoshikimate 1-carboxyvinyltransferase [Acidimicrobiia bacterium]
MGETRTLEPASGPFQAGVRAPGDKSLSHRALVLAALADGESEIVGLAPGRDVAATLTALERLGLRRNGDQFVPSASPDNPNAPIDCGNSGTTMRLLAGSLASLPFRLTLVGDDSLSARPMARLVEPLAALGVEVTLSVDGTAPIATGAADLHGADVAIDVASAQVRSAFEFAAIQADGPSTIDSPGGFRDHTERWLAAFELAESEGTRTRITPGPVPGAQYLLPGDPSSAAYVWASAALVPGARVVTPDVSLNPGRLGFLGILEAMGAEVHGEVTGSIHGDPIGTVSVLGAHLRSVEVSGDTVASAIDELPLVAVLGAYAEGITVVRDAAELRVKESDRTQSTATMIRALGGGAEATDDGFEVLGTGFLDGGTVNADGDHRIAMSAAVAATAAQGAVTIVGSSVAGVSWPSFYETLEAVWSSR